MSSFMKWYINVIYIRGHLKMDEGGDSKQGK